MMKKILMIVSSHRDMENTDVKTGVWLRALADAYYTFFDEGFEVTLVSPKGGRPPADPLSELPEHLSAATGRFLADMDAQLAFGNTWKLGEIKAGDFDAAFYLDDYGAFWDLAGNDLAEQLLLDLYDAGKPVALVGHGTAALIPALALRPEFFEGKLVTCFSSTEEALLKRHHYIPFELDTRLKALRFDCRKAIIPFTQHVETDGLLITGQNPASANAAAQALVKKLFFDT